MLEIKLLPGSEVEIIGEISAEDFERYKKEAINDIAVLFLQKEYVKIITGKKIKAIGRPTITITKLAPNNPLGFKIKTYVMPEVDLPDYKGMKLEEIVEKAKIDIPKILLEAENGDEKRVKTSLVLNEIAEREKIEVSEEELNAEVSKIMEEHKDLDRERVKIYAYGIIKNQKVIKFLETC